MDDKRPGKLRRNRDYTADGVIESRPPSAKTPHSRRYAMAEPAARERDAETAAATGLAPERAVDCIICGDAAPVLGQLPAESCACAVTSPPYWHTVDYGICGQIGLGSYERYLDELDAVWVETARVLLPNGKFCLNVPLLPLAKSVSAQAFGATHTRMLIDLYADIKRRIETRTCLRLFSLYIWEKQTTEKMFGSYPFPPNLYERNYVEFIAVFVKPGAPRVLPTVVKKASRLSSAEWMDLTRQIWWMYPDNVARQDGHPAPFPEALPNRLIAMYTFRAVPEAGFPGDIVLDPFAGSGTTCVAARRLGRRYIGIELNREFCRLARQRVLSTPVRPAVLSGRRPDERPSSQPSLWADPPAPQPG